VIVNPKWLILPGAYRRNSDGVLFPTADPIGDCIRAAANGDDAQMAPGEFPRQRGSIGGRRGFHLCGWDRRLGLSIIKRDELVGSSDNLLLQDGDREFVIESVNIELDDRAGVKTTNTVGPRNNLLDVMMYGRGSPYDPTWTDSAKWGVHAYQTSGWAEVRVYKWSIYGEHGGYFHNIQGDHGFAEGGVGRLGGCDLFFANRMNEGPPGKGDVTIRDRTIEDVCIGQGGSALTFRGGMPDSTIRLERVKARLGCKPQLAAPFNQNICGVLSVDSADETAPGKGDAAWPGGTLACYVTDCDFEVGTIYPGRTGMIRPVISIAACCLFEMDGTRLHVNRAPGAYPIALSLSTSVNTVSISRQNDVQGWIEWHPDGPDGARFTSLNDFLDAHPECEKT